MFTQGLRMQLGTSQISCGQGLRLYILNQLGNRIKLDYQMGFSLMQHYKTRSKGTFSNLRVMKPPAMGRAPFRSSGNRSQAKMLTKQPTSAELASLTMMQVCGKGGSLSLAYSVKLVSDQVIFQQIIRNSCRNSRIPSGETRWFSKCFGILTTVFKYTSAICSSDKILTGEVDYNSNKESAKYVPVSSF